MSETMSADHQPALVVVDDDASVRKAFTLMLSAQGYLVHSAEGGRQAVALLNEINSSAECVLLDIRMRDMSGIEVLHLVHRQYPLIPVIMVSANDELDIAVECMRQGAFDYVSKPVQRTVLVETINKALRHRALLLENRRLSEENAAHQRHLEEMVSRRTEQLSQAYGLLKRHNIETVRVLAETIEAKDSYTRGHCNRVRNLSVGLAKRLGFSQAEIEALEYAALLHDIGKIGVPESILNKTGPLPENERLLFQKHPVVGETILKPLEFFRPCLPAVRHHHERFDGGGYPDGFTGTAIHPGARIVAIADAFDAMTSTRSYRPAMNREDALEQLRSGRATQFDPQFVDCFLENRIYLEL